MADLSHVFDQMLATWNETDPSRVRGRIEEALAPEVRFVDPLYDIQGLDAFESMVHEFRKKYPDAICSRSSGVDSHHQLHRYHWEIHRSGELFIPGFDVVETDGSNRVASVLGFFGPIPPIQG